MNKFEKMPVGIFDNAAEAVEKVAGEIASLIKQKQKEKKNFVLGLATGSTPIGLYEELIRLHQSGLSFKNVITFNLDEYFPMDPRSQQSYVRFMKDYLFDHIDIEPSNINIPDGTLPANKVADFCRRYE